MPQKMKRGANTAGASRTKPAAVHPGRVLRMLLDENGVTQTALARHIGVAIPDVNLICNEKRRVSPGMATLLGQALGTGAEFWLGLTTAFEMATARPAKDIGILVKGKR